MDNNEKLNVEQIKPLFSPKSLAEYLNVPKDTVNKWIHSGRLPKPDVMIGSRLIRWKYKTIMNLVNSGQILD